MEQDASHKALVYQRAEHSNTSQMTSTGQGNSVLPDRSYGGEFAYIQRLKICCQTRAQSTLCTVPHISLLALVCNCMRWGNKAVTAGMHVSQQAIAHLGPKEGTTSCTLSCMPNSLVMYRNAKRGHFSCTLLLSRLTCARLDTAVGLPTHGDDQSSLRKTVRHSVKQPANATEQRSLCTRLA
jgi:hypothetical protein